jgi:hypothetical protein
MSLSGTLFWMRFSVLFSIMSVSEHASIFGLSIGDGKLNRVGVTLVLLRRARV